MFLLLLVPFCIFLGIAGVETITVSNRSIVSAPALTLTTGNSDNNNNNNNNNSINNSSSSFFITTTRGSGGVGIFEEDDNIPLSGTLTVSASVTNTVQSNLTKSFFAIPINNGQVTGFTIGGLFPLSINGSASTSGVQLAEAFKCSLNAANNNQGIIRNISLLYSIQDTDLNQNGALEQALILERRGTFAIVGPYSNMQVVPVANLYNTASTPLISYGAGSFSLGNSTLFPTFLRVWPPDTFQARAMAETFRLLGWTFIAALFTNDDYGQSGRQSLLAATSRQRIRVTCLNNIFPNSTQGLQNFSDCVAASDATVVVLWMGPESAAAVISTMHSNPANNRTTFVASNEWALISNMTRFIEDGRRVTGLTFPPDYLQGSLGFYPMIGSTAMVRACFSQITPANTNYTQFNEVWQREFSCSITDDDTVSLCPEQIGERTSRCRCRGNEDFNDIPLPPDINYAYDAGTVYANALNFMMNPRTCGRIIGGDYCNLTELTSTQLLGAAIQASFRGMTGDVSFNRTNPDRRRSYFDVFQYNATNITIAANAGNGNPFGGAAEEATVVRPNQVGFWNISGVFLSSSALYWKTGKDVPLSGTLHMSVITNCGPSVIVPQNTQVDDYLGAVFVIILAILLSLICLFMMLFFLIYRRTRVVRLSNFWFIQFVLLGTLMVMAGIIIWSVYQTKLICMTKAFLMMLGFAIIVGCLLAKAVRYFLIYTNYGRQTERMTFWELSIPLTIVILINSILIVLYIFPGGLPDRIVTQSSSDTTYLFIACSKNDNTYGDIIIYLFLGYNILMIIAAFVFMLMSRALLTPFKEGIFLLFVLADMLILCAVLIPIYYTTGDRRGSVQQQYLIRSLGILFGLTFTVLALFAPKIIAVSRILKGGEGEGAAAGTVGSEGSKGRYGITDEESSDESVAGGGAQFYSDNVIRRSGGTSQASTDSEVGKHSSGTGSSLGG